MKNFIRTTLTGRATLLSATLVATTFLASVFSTASLADYSEHPEAGAFVDTMVDDHQFDRQQQHCHGSKEDARICPPLKQMRFFSNKKR